MISEYAVLVSGIEPGFRLRWFSWLVSEGSDPHVLHVRLYSKYPLMIDPWFKIYHVIDHCNLGFCLCFAKRICHPTSSSCCSWFYLIIKNPHNFLLRLLLLISLQKRFCDSLDAMKIFRFLKKNLICNWTSYPKTCVFRLSCGIAPSRWEFFIKAVWFWLEDRPHTALKPHFINMSAHE